MKVVMRVLIILVAALVVGGATYALEQSGVIQMGAPTREEGGEFRQPPNFTAENGAAGATAVAQREGGGGLRGLNDIVQSLSIVAVIVALFALVKFVWDKSWGKRRQRKREQPQAAI